MEKEMRSLFYACEAVSATFDGREMGHAYRMITNGDRGHENALIDIDCRTPFRSYSHGGYDSAPKGQEGKE